MSGHWRLGDRCRLYSAAGMGFVGSSGGWGGVFSPVEVGCFPVRSSVDEGDHWSLPEFGFAAML